MFLFEGYPLEIERFENGIISSILFGGWNVETVIPIASFSEPLGLCHSALIGVFDLVKW